MATSFDTLPTALKQALAAFYDDLVAQGVSIVLPPSLPTVGNPNALPFAAITSVGIYEKSTGRLVRTLWNNQMKGAGLLPAPWDKKDDAGVTVSDPTLYEARLNYFKQTAKPNFLGRVGNTSPQNRTQSIPFIVDDSSGNVVPSDVHFGWDFFQDIDIHPSDSKALSPTGYTEGPQSHGSFALNDIQKKISYQLPVPSANRLTQATCYVTQDNTNAHHVGYDGYDADQHGDRYSPWFVYATSRTTGNRVPMSGGTPYTIQQGRENKGITYSAYKLKGRAGDAASQRNGPCLFISQPETDEIVVLNKATYALIATITTFTRPGRLHVDREDRLWVSSVNPGNPNTTPVKIPVTGDVSPIGTAGYGTDFQFSLDKAFDGNPNTYYASTVNAPDGQLGLYFGAEQWVVTELHLQPSGGREADCQGWVQLSNTNFDDVKGRDWKTVLEITTPPASGSFTTYKFTNSQVWKYGRVYNPGKGFKVQDMEWWGYKRTDTPVVACYTVAANGTLTPANISLSGLQEPLALTDDGLGNLYVMEGGSKQALCRYSKANGGAATATWTSTQDVRFYVSDSYGTMFYGQQRPGALACAPDNSVWFGDYGNNRLVHLSTTGAYIEHIAYQPANRSCEGDANVKERLFGDNREFLMDYKTAGQLNWKLLGNWSRFYNSRQHGYLREITTLSNGRTYAIIGQDSFLGQPMRRVVELIPNTAVRDTGKVLAYGTQFTPTGDVYRYEYDTNQVTKVYKQTLNGFDASGNPQWSAETPLPDGPTPKEGDPKRSIIRRHPTGLNVVYDGRRSGAGGSTDFHIASWLDGQNFFKFRTARTTPGNYVGPYPTDGRFDSGNGAGNTEGPMVLLRDLTSKPKRWSVRVYAGEGWGGKQACWVDIEDLDTGLLLFHFGADAIANPAQMMSVVLGAVAVRVDADRVMLFFNEEGGEGLPAWEITGIATGNLIITAPTLSLAS